LGGFFIHGHNLLHYYYFSSVNPPPISVKLIIGLCALKSLMVLIIMVEQEKNKGSFGVVSCEWKAEEKEQR